MNTEGDRASRSWRTLRRSCLLVTAVLLLTGVTALADDCGRDPTNLQDCMRTGWFREGITIIAVLLGISPMVLASRLGLSADEIRTLIHRDWWNPEAEHYMAWDYLRGGRPDKPEFRDLRGDLIGPGRTPVQRIYDGDRAKRILRDLDAWSIVEGLKTDDSQIQMKLEKVMQQVKDHRQVKGISVPHEEVTLPDGTTKKVYDLDNVVIVLEEPEYRLPPPPPPPPTPQPVTIPTPPPTPKVPKPDKPPDVRDVYKKAPTNYRMAQDLVLSQATGQPPSHGGQDKGEVFRQLINHGYRPHVDGEVKQPADVDRLRKRLKDEDVVMLGIHNAPTGVEADHYLIIKRGRIWEVQNLPDRGQLHDRPLKDVGSYFRPSRTVIDGQSGRGIRTGVPYRYWAIFRRRA